MKRETKIKDKLKQLTPKQQKLDFVKPRLWEQLPADDRQACREALATLLSQVTLATTEHPKHA